MDRATQKKWDSTAAIFDLMAGFGPEKRWAPTKIELFANMDPNAKILFAAVGTGLDIPLFPPGCNITGIDISPKMLEKAEKRAHKYRGNLQLQVMDILEPNLPAAEFDQIFTSCTFCSVPNPIMGLKAIKTLLKPGGKIFMYEHTGSQFPPFKWILNLANPLLRHLGPEINRPTEKNVLAAGFEIISTKNIFLDVVKVIVATNPQRLP